MRRDFSRERYGNSGSGGGAGTTRSNQENKQKKVDLDIVERKTLEYQEKPPRDSFHLVPDRSVVRVHRVKVPISEQAHGVFSSKALPSMLLESLSFCCLRLDALSRNLFETEFSERDFFDRRPDLRDLVFNYLLYELWHISISDQVQNSPLLLLDNVPYHVSRLLSHPTVDAQLNFPIVVRNLLSQSFCATNHGLSYIVKLFTHRSWRIEEGDGKSQEIMNYTTLFI